MQFLMGFLGSFFGLISLWILMEIIKIIKDKFKKPKIKKDILNYTYNHKFDEKLLNNDIKLKNKTKLIGITHHYDEEKNYIDSSFDFEFYNEESIN